MYYDSIVTFNLYYTLLLRGGNFAVPSRITHQKFNFIIGPPTALLLLSLLAYKLDLNLILLVKFAVIFFVAFAYNTIVFNPDMDLARYVRPLSWKGFWYIPFIPYSWFFSHRGYSHSFWLGTLTRIVYVFFLFCALLFVYLEIDNYYNGVGLFYGEYNHFLGLSNLQKILLENKWEFLTAIAAFVYGDIIHILLDRVMKN